MSENDFKNIRKLQELSLKMTDLYTDCYMKALYGETDDALKTLHDLGVLCDTLRKKTEDVINGSEVYEASEQSENLLNAEFFYDEKKKVFHMTYPGRLPSRPDGDYNRFSHKASLYKSDVKSSFNSFFNRRKIRYLEPVIVHFILHYKDVFTMKDNDNVEVKPIIDEIAYHMTGDDSPLNMSLFVEGTVDGREAVEVYVQPKNIRKQNKV